MRSLRWRLGLACGVLFLLAGCEFLWGDPLGFTPAQQKLAHRVFDRPLAERIRMFDSLSVTDQYAVYRYGCTREPPADYLRSPLARHGAELMPLVRTRLETHSDLGEVRDDLTLLAEIRRLGTADVAADTTLLALLRKRVAGLRSPGWREGCAEQVAALALPDSVGSVVTR